jgi:hypothetical protein
MFIHYMFRSIRPSSGVKIVVRASCCVLVFLMVVYCNLGSLPVFVVCFNVFFRVAVPDKYTTQKNTLQQTTNAGSDPKLQWTTIRKTKTQQLPRTTILTPDDGRIDRNM